MSSSISLTFWSVSACFCACVCAYPCGSACLCKSEAKILHCSSETIHLVGGHSLQQNWEVDRKAGCQVLRKHLSVPSQPSIGIKRTSQCTLHFVTCVSRLKLKSSGLEGKHYGLSYHQSINILFFFFNFRTKIPSLKVEPREQKPVVTSCEVNTGNEYDKNLDLR